MMFVHFAGSTWNLTLFPLVIFKMTSVALTTSCMYRSHFCNSTLILEDFGHSFDTLSCRLGQSTSTIFSVGLNSVGKPFVFLSSRDSASQISYWWLWCGRDQTTRRTPNLLSVVLEHASSQNAQGDSGLHGLGLIVPGSILTRCSFRHDVYGSGCSQVCYQ